MSDSEIEVIKKLVNQHMDDVKKLACKNFQDKQKPVIYRIKHSIEKRYESVDRIVRA